MEYLPRHKRQNKVRAFLKNCLFISIIPLLLLGGCTGIIFWGAWNPDYGLQTFNEKESKLQFDVPKSSELIYGYFDGILGNGIYIGIFYLPKSINVMNIKSSRQLEQTKWQFINKIEYPLREKDFDIYEYWKKSKVIPIDISIPTKKEFANSGPFLYKSFCNGGITQMSECIRAGGISHRYIFDTKSRLLYVYMSR